MGIPRPIPPRFFCMTWYRPRRAMVRKSTLTGPQSRSNLTIVQFEGDELVLDHGGLQLNTSRGMRVRVNCMTVIPLTQEWTRYDVTDVDGRMMVVAQQNDVKIHYQGAAARPSKKAGFSDVTVHQGEQGTREEGCGTPAKPAGVAAVAHAILDNPWAIGAGSAAIGTLTCWVLCRGDEPVSPSKP